MASLLASESKDPKLKSSQAKDPKPREQALHTQPLLTSRRPTFSQGCMEQSWSQRRRAEWHAVASRLWPVGMLARDDSIVHDDEIVYVVEHESFNLPSPLQRIDYFHGFHPVKNAPMAQMVEDCTDVPSFSMVSTRGSFALAIACIQCNFRTKRLLRAFHLYVCCALSACRLLPQALRSNLIADIIARFYPMYGSFHSAERPAVMVSSAAQPACLNSDEHDMGAASHQTIFPRCAHE